MWNKKVYLSNHVKQRYIERHITMCKEFRQSKNLYAQVKKDIKPLNIVLINRLKTGCIKVITKQGKVYILEENENSVLVKTVYQKNLKDLLLRKESQIRYKN